MFCINAVNLVIAFSSDEIDDKKTFLMVKNLGLRVRECTRYKCTNSKIPFFFSPLWPLNCKYYTTHTHTFSEFFFDRFRSRRRLFPFYAPALRCACYGLAALAW